MRLLGRLARSVTFWWHVADTTFAIVGLVGNVVMESRLATGGVVRPIPPLRNVKLAGLHEYEVWP